MAVDPLDFPIWTALTTRQSGIAEGGALAKRFPTAIAPFAATADASPESFAALHKLMSSADVSVLFTPEAVVAPKDFEIALAATGEQMIGSPRDATTKEEVIRLGAADAPEMLALVELTKPGPFSLRTHELGNFFGIRIDGRLAAMTGERMKPGNYTEMTAICVHPDFRRRGLAQALMSVVARQIEARGEIPFLHVFSENASAIALYKQQGMEIRRTLHVTVLKQAGGTASVPKLH
jgi:ribosomal protein S18 acetylase RimI-like enzyme